MEAFFQQQKNMPEKCNTNKKCVLYAFDRRFHDHINPINRYIKFIRILTCKAIDND